MKKILNTRKANGKVNPYPFLILVVLVLALIFVIFHIVFKNLAF